MEQKTIDELFKECEKTMEAGRILFKKEQEERDKNWLSECEQKKCSRYSRKQVNKCLLNTGKVSPTCHPFYLTKFRLRMPQFIRCMSGNHRYGDWVNNIYSFNIDVSRKCSSCGKEESVTHSLN